MLEKWKQNWVGSGAVQLALDVLAWSRWCNKI